MPPNNPFLTSKKERSMKELKLSDVRKSFKFTMNKGMSFDGFDLYEKCTHPVRMDYDVYLPTKGMNLQRELCWTLHQKQEFILSILKGNSIPKISLIQHRDVDNITAEKVNQVIDGKQRITTYASFINGGFALSSGHNISDLAKDAQNELLRFWFVADIAYSYYDKPITDDEKIDWFEQINFTGTPQDADHLLKLKTCQQP